LKTSPEYASILGDKRYNDQVSDNSVEGLRREYQANRKFLARFRSVDTTGFSEQERLNKELMVQDLEDAISDFEWREWEMPVTQRSGIHLFAAQFPALL